MIETKWLGFDCQECGGAIEAKSDLLGKEVGCPCCLKPTKVEARNALPLEEVRKAAPRANGKDVPIKMGLGKLGSFETTLSKKNAGKLAHTFLGGLLVALGVIVCMMLGVKPPNRG